MKRKITFLIAVIAALMLNTQPMKAVGQTRSTYSIELKSFSGSSQITNVSPLSNYLNDGSSYVSSIEPTNVYQAGNGNGWRVGTKNVGSLVINLNSTAQAYTVSKITINAKVWSTDGSSLQVTVTDTDDTNVIDGEKSDELSSDFDDYDFDIDTPTTIKTITIANTAGTKRFYIKSITVTYSTGNPVTVTSPIANGSISAAPNSGVSANTNVTLTITPDDGYALSTLSVVDGSSNPITVTNKVFKMPNSAATVTGTFATKRQVTYSATNGTIVGVDCSGTTVAANGYVGQGGTLKVTATPTSGYIFTGWEVSSGTTIDDASANPAVVTLGLADATITALFSASYTVTYHANGGTGDDVVENKLAGASVVAIANPFTPADGKLFNYYTLDEEGNGTHYAPGVQITASISANMNVYAQWRDIRYTVTLDVNGNTSEFSPITNIAYGGNTGAIPNATMDGYSFMGWSETRNGSIAVNPGGSYSPTGSDEAITLYAVFGTMGTGNFTIVANSDNTSNLPTSYTSSGDGEWKINNVLYFKHHYVMRGQNSTNYYIQFKSDGGYFYNVIDFGKITSIVATYATGSGTNVSREIAIRINSEVCDEASDGEVMSVDNSGNVYTFTYDTDKKDYHYFRIYNSSTTSTLASVVIYYEAAAPVTINPISENESINNDGQLTANVTISSGVYYADEVITIPNGKTLTVSGTGVLVNDNPTNLVINDGGQLICSNSVAATVKKTIEDPSKTDYGHWYTISTPVHKGSTNNVVISETNLTSVGSENYDMFAYDEENGKWLNQKKTYNNEEPPVQISAGFSNMTVGRGYLYRNNGTDLVITGNTNTGNEIIYTLTKTGSTAISGFNLIGNPFPHNIYKGAGTAIPNSIAEGYVLTTGFYTLTNEGGWHSCTDNTTPITPYQGVLVQATKDGILTFTDTDEKDSGGAKSNNDNIKFIVANSQYEDVTYALFDEGFGLSKINHRNADIPMLYINQNGEDYAIATMGDETKSFNLNFKAMTTGRYTLSYKAKGEFNYLHIIDRITGEDVDMLLEGEYSFIASPNDSGKRFIVRLGYNAGNETSDDIFAYQSGNDIVVNGEGELQVFDVTGRMVKIQRINGVQTINLNTQGVYIFRLNEKIQKIVVE